MSVASPTIEYSELNKTPDMNDGYKPCGSNSNGDERRWATSKKCIFKWLL
jgi:hypothetical protein